ncbi:MAG: co-chaperone GroES [Candidatus Hodgkinia cicadicola]
MLTKLVIDKITYYVKIKTLVSPEVKLVCGSLWIGFYAITVTFDSKFLLVVPFDGSELIGFRLLANVDYFSFIKISMINIMRTRRRILLKLLAKLLNKQLSISPRNSSPKTNLIIKKLLWTGKLSLASLPKEYSFAILKLNRALKICTFALKTNYASLESDPFKLRRVNNLVATIAHHFKIPPTVLFFNLKLSLHPSFAKTNINISEIQQITIKTTILNNLHRLGQKRIQLLRHHWLSLIKRINHLLVLTATDCGITVPFGFLTLFFRVILFSLNLPTLMKHSNITLEWRNNIILILNYANYILSFYKLSHEVLPIIPLLSVTLNKLKSSQATFASSGYLTENQCNRSIDFHIGIYNPKNLPMKLKPLFNRVIINPDDSTKNTAGGIILSGVTKDIIIIGTIEGVSDGLEFCYGDRVLYNRNTALRYCFNGRVVDILDAIEVLAIVCNE